ncbi:LOW QUALITY PROTEIN: smad nuclear-interacting protein 1 [Pterocles gutturalis]
MAAADAVAMATTPVAVRRAHARAVGGSTSEWPLAAGSGAHFRWGRWRHGGGGRAAAGAAAADGPVKAEKRSPRRSASARRGAASPRRGRRGRSRSPKRRSKAGRRSRSPRGRRSRSPHAAAVRVKQERDDHCRRGNEERKQRYTSEQEHRRERSSDRDRHRDRSDRRKNSSERPGARGHERERDVQNIREQQAEEFYNERREHRQNNEGSGGDQHPELRQSDSKPKEKAPVNKEKPSFELSGALLEDTNTFRGVVIKYSEPPEARIPKKRWRLYPFKNDEFLPVMYIHRQSAYLLGRHRRIADIPIDHPSFQHAVFQYRLVEYTRADGTVGRRVRPYIIDLGSGNGTFLNNQRIEPQRYYELKEKDVLKFGFSREYVLLHESSDKSEANAKDDDGEEKEEESDS